MNTLEEYIDRIIDDTGAGKMVWAKSNPTTFVWRKSTTPQTGAQLSLQKLVHTQTRLVPGARPVITMNENFVFQALERPTGHIKLAINTQQDEALRDKLKILFEKISENAERAGLDFLKDVIGE